MTNVNPATRREARIGREAQLAIECALRLTAGQPAPSATRTWPTATPIDRLPAYMVRRSPRPWWSDLSYEELLSVRLCDLELQLKGSALQTRVERLYAEIERLGLRFRPHVWLSTDWFTPDGVAGFAAPFFLAHPRLARIEHRQMFQTEGGTAESCMQLLRHEAGHAIDNAWRLRRKRRYRETFGSPSTPYRESYVPKPGSRDFVQNLDGWYAQSHPTEDFAETFAVWLRRAPHWRSRYEGWPALTKLTVVDDLMNDIAASVAPVRSRKTPDSLARLRMTLGDYYLQKKAFYGTEPTTLYDRYLKRVFAVSTGKRRSGSAAEFMRRSRREIRARVSAITGRHRYVVDQVVQPLILRCRELRLQQVRSDSQTLTDVAILVSLLTTRVQRIAGKPIYR